MDKTKKIIRIIGEFAVAVIVVGGCGILARYGAEWILTHIINGG